MYPALSVVMFMAFTGAAICYIAVQMARAVKMMWTLSKWLWTQRQSERKGLLLPPPANHGYVLCPICFGESHYNPMKGQYECESHGLVAYAEHTRYATRN